MEKRFILALILSAAILFGWEYFIRPRSIPQQNGASQQAAVTKSQQTSDVPTPVASTSPATQPTATSTEEGHIPSKTFTESADAAPRQIVTVATPLYNVRLDNRGAIATSWVIKKNKDTERALFSVVSDKGNPQQLELISAKGLEREPREAPFRIVTGDDSLDLALATGNYVVSGVDGENRDENNDASSIELKPGDSRRIEFVMRDDAAGLNVTKSITFNADSYIVDLQADIKQGGQQTPNIKIAVGPSIGDQGVSRHTFYSVAPEGIAVINGQTRRDSAASLHMSDESSNSSFFGGLFGGLFGNSNALPESKGQVKRHTVNGMVSWAGVGDTYFAMVAIPAKPVEGLEYRTLKYEHHEAKDERHLITSLVPIPTNGSLMRLYVGPKDHYLLTNASASLSRLTGSEIDLDGLIDYGFGSSISRPIAIYMLGAIKYLSALTGSYGVAIILFTVFIYSLFFPLKWRSSKAMKKAQKLAPQMKELQEKIKGVKQNDPRLKELQMEQLRLMKEGNPLGGCLPLLIQMPFLFAFFRAITISLDFRQSPFLWINDLSSADPYYLLPVLMAGSMLVLQLITPAPSADPLQRKMMAVVLPLVMLFTMYSAPAALLVYWLVANVVGFSQQMLINKLVKSKDDEEPLEPTPPTIKKTEASAYDASLATNSKA